MESSADTLIEIFRNHVGTIYQCDESSTIWLDFQGEMTPFRYFGFLSIKQHVDKVNVESMFENTTKGGDLEIINARGCDRCFVVNLKELIGLKQLFEGTKVMLDLNSIIQERLHNILI